jgi:uncharacterized protein
MRLSEERISHLSRLVVDGIWNDDLVDYVDDDAALRAAKKGLTEFMSQLEEVDTAAKGKVASLKRGVQEGSPEWDIMYAKYFEEEMQRRGHV